MLAEIIHPLPHRTVANSKFLGDFLLGTAVDKDGTQRLVATMAGMGRLAKKVLATAVIHDLSSLEMSIILRDKPRKMVWSNCTAVDENRRQTLKNAAHHRGHRKNDQRRTNPQPAKTANTNTPETPKKPASRSPECYPFPPCGNRR
jgi:hypothetical protein